MKSQHRYARALCGAAVVILLPLTGLLLRSIWPDAGPRTLADAARLAQAQGLYWRADALHGPLNIRIVISETPLTWERAATTRLSPGHPSLVGTVAVYDHHATLAPGYRDCGCSAPWGELFLFGDPRLIKQLTGAFPEGAPGGRY